MYIGYSLLTDHVVTTRGSRNTIKKHSDWLTIVALISMEIVVLSRAAAVFAYFSPVMELETRAIVSTSQTALVLWDQRDPEFYLSVHRNWSIRHCKFKMIKSPSICERFSPTIKHTQQIPTNIFNH